MRAALDPGTGMIRGKPGMGIVGIALLALLVSQNAVAGDLHIFVGAGLRQPVDLLVRKFEDRTGNRVMIDYGGSGQLLARIEACGKGDLFVPGSLFYIEKLEKAGSIRSLRRIVQHTPVVGVNIHQAGRITAFEHLARPGVRLAMGDPKAMAFGRTAMTICEKSGMKDAILKNVVVYGATVKQLAMYVSQGVVDAAFIGRSDAFQHPETIRMISIPSAYFQAEIVAVAVLQTASNVDLAEDLAAAISSPDAVNVFKQYGFLPLQE